MGLVTVYRAKIDGQSSEIILADLLASHGPLLNRAEVPAAVVAQYEGLLPAIVLDFWEHCGVGAFAGGRIRFVLPAHYAQAVAALFAGDPDFGDGCHAVALGPFGDLMIWSERHHLLFVGLPLAMVDAPFLNQRIAEEQIDRIALDYLFKANPAIFDTADDDGEPMFQRAEAALGPLGAGEIYGTVPPMTFDEPIAVETLHRVVADDWLAEKFAGTEFQLADVAKREFNIRPIGPS